MRVIPGFLVHSENEFRKRLLKFKGLATHIHIDAMDGQFVPNTTWADAKAIERLLPEGMTYELHVMANDPLSYVKQHRVKHVRRYIFHVESPVEATEMIAAGKGQQKEVYLAINPETALEKVTQHCAAIDGILVMGSTPGFSGKALDLKRTRTRLEKLRKHCPQIARVVDSGVNDRTAPLLRKAGATELISTSYLTSTGDVAEAMKVLQGS